MLDIDIRPYFICRLRVPQPLDQSLVLRATAPGAQRYQVGVGVSEFADRADTHAAPLAHGFIGSNDADNKRFNSGQRRSGRSQPPDVLRDALSLISLKRFQIKPVFVAERVVHALSADIHCTQQIVCRSCSITLSPENGHRPFYGPITIKFPRSCHRCELANLDCSVNNRAVVKIEAFFFNCRFFDLSSFAAVHKIPTRSEVQRTSGDPEGRSIRSDALYPALSGEWEVPVTRNAKITPVNEGGGGRGRGASPPGSPLAGSPITRNAEIDPPPA